MHSISQLRLPLSLFLLLSLLTTTLSAQSVFGQLIDDTTGDPIGFANLAVYDADNELVGGTTSDIDGDFNIAGLSVGQWRLEATFIGYETLVREFAVTSPNQEVGTGVLALKTDGAMDLEEITVTAERAVMELGLDRKSFNVEKSIAASGGSAEDLLRQIPSVTVDIDGNVSLRGSGNVRFLINGKPSGLVGDDPVTFLKSLSASNIETIEVITNPGAAFDPDGTAGLINIVLKRKRDDGFNATATVNVGTNNKFDGSLDLNWRKGKFNSFAGVSGRHDERFFEGFREQTGTIQDSSFSRFFTFDGDRLRKSTLAKLGTEYELSKLATIGIQGNYQWQTGESSNLRGTDFFNSEGILDRRSERLEFEPETENEYEVRLNYDQRFAREGRRLSANLQYSGEDELEIENYDELVGPAERQRAPSDQRENQFLGQLDYVQEIGEFKFETGWRTTLSRISTDAEFQNFDFAEQVFITDRLLSNLFSYEEDVHALYATYGGTIKKFSFSAGLRAEQVYTTSLLEEPNREEFNNDYFKVYPSVFTGYAFDDNTSLQLSYSRRVNRPRAWALNPFVDRGDPFNLRSGNPFLLPELINSFELNLQQRYGAGTITGGLYFRQQKDVINRVTIVLEDGVQLGTRDNIDRGRDYGIELITTYRPAKGLDLMVSGNGYRSEVIGRAGDEQIDQNGYLFSGNVQAGYELPAGISTQLTYFYRSPGIRPQGRVDAIQSLDLGFRKDVLNERGTVTLRVTDVFNQRRYSYLVETGGLRTQSQFQRESRIVYLGFQYSLREVKGKGRGNEDGRGGGGDDGDF